MNRNTAIKILLRSPHLNRYPKPLQYLPTPQAQNMQSHNPLVLPLANKLILRGPLILLIHYGVIDRRERGLVDLDVILAVFLLGFFLRETDGADFRMGKDDRGDEVVVQLAGAFNYINKVRETSINRIRSCKKATRCNFT